MLFFVILSACGERDIQSKELRLEDYLDTTDTADSDSNVDDSGVDEEEELVLDDDGDGWSETDGDCDDTNPDINPGEAEEECNGIDNDCDGEIDEDWDEDQYELADEETYNLGNLSNSQDFEVQAYISNEEDIDRYVFYAEDGWFDSFGFAIYLTDVPTESDYELNLAYLSEDGDEDGSIASSHTGGFGENETIEFNGQFASDDTGWYTIEVYSHQASSCAHAYRLVVTTDF